MRRLWTLVVAMMMVLASAGPASATVTEVDIDSNGDCEIEDVVDDGFENTVAVNVAINGKWIIATCHVQLTQGEMAALVGGPLMKPYKNSNFTCLVGNDDTLEDVVASAQHLVVTPSGVLNISCKAENPGSQPE